MRTTSFLFLLVFLAGCSRNTSVPLDRQTFVDVYADLEATLWAVKRTTGDTTVIARAADSVLAAHQVTPDRYRATVKWYAEDWRRWKGFYDDVAKTLEDRARKETRQPPPR